MATPSVVAATLLHCGRCLDPRLRGRALLAVVWPEQLVEVHGQRRHHAPKCVGLPGDRVNSGRDDTALSDVLLREAPFVTWTGFPAEQFEIETDSKQPAWYESSPGARRAFCPQCGSPMFFESKRWPGEVHVARALIDGTLDKEPSAHVYFETHVPWVQVNDNLPKKVSQGSQMQQASQGKQPVGGGPLVG